MQPFSLICKSCAARLKVTKASAVGQLLACPKCGTMLHVTPPEGWSPPPSQSDSQISAENLDASAVAGKGNFEDIEDLLDDALPGSNPPHTPAASHQQPAAQNAAQNAAPSAARKSTPVESPQQNSDQLVKGPVLPNEQWTGEGTRRRKTFSLVLFGALATILLLAAVCIAIVLNASSKNNETVNTTDPDPQPNPDPVAIANDPGGMLDEDDLVDVGPFAEIPVDKQAGPDVGEAPPIIDARPPAENNQVANNQAAKNQTKNNNDQVANEPPANVGGKNSKLQEMSAPGIGEVVNPNQENEGNDQEIKELEAPPKLSGSSPFSPPSPNSPLDIEPTKEPPQKTQIGMVEAFENDLGNLTDLLAGAGTSLLEFKDLTAAIRTRENIGIPKYIISKPDLPQLEIEEQLELFVPGVKFDSPVHLQRILSDLSSLSGLPMTIDARSIAATGKLPNPEIKFEKSNASLKETLDDLLTPLEMQYRVEGNGISIGVFPTDQKTQKTFDFPTVIALDPESRLQLISEIQVLIAPESWVVANDPATIAVKDNQLTVNCSESVQNQVGDLLAKLNASLKIKADPADPTAKKTLASKWKKLAPGLAQKSQLKQSVQSELTVFLERLSEQTGITTIPDFNALLNDGWGPQTSIPGNVVETTMQQTIEELTRSMNLTYTAVDDKTLMITTYDRSAQLIDLEVYALSGLVPERLPSPQFQRLIIETLGSQLNSEKVRYIYQPVCNCLIVTAPQQIQRQVEALIERLKKELNGEPDDDLNLIQASQ
ncbi:MAG: hypothetical protein GY748_04180 [Planctomycetaceae bacterium]|nr:hypothetical protein [Planctomycetaceae bacterium]